MAELVCEKVGPGMRPSERTVAVKDVFGQREFLRVEHDFLTAVGDRYFLPVGVVQEDREKSLVLVELPQEGEWGGWRLWVRAADLLPTNGSPQ